MQNYVSGTARLNFRWLLRNRKSFYITIRNYNCARKKNMTHPRRKRETGGQNIMKFSGNV